MNFQVINCPNCGKKMIYTKNDVLFGDNKFRCNKCNKTYIEKINMLFFIDLIDGNLLISPRKCL